MNIKYVGAALDFSGYGECSRNDIAALTTTGYNLTVEMPTYVREFADYGKLQKLALSYKDAIPDNDIDVNIIHLTPNLIPKYLLPNAKNIARIVWETDRLPPTFIQGMQNLQAIITPSQYTKTAIEKDIKHIPIHIVPEALEAVDIVKKHTTEDTTMFYSIFEWTERKNPTALLTAYLQDFTKDDNVKLILKTYRENYQRENQEYIKKQIKSIATQVGNTNTPPVYVISNLLNNDQIQLIHAQYDCFVLPHRGEGWCIPIQEAIQAGNMIIATNLGGIHEYMNPDYYTGLHHRKTTVNNTSNKQWYLNNQNWADIDILELRKAMRDYHTNKSEWDKKARLQKSVVYPILSYSAIAKKLKQIITTL